MSTKIAILKLSPAFNLLAFRYLSPKTAIINYESRGIGVFGNSIFYFASGKWTSSI